MTDYRIKPETGRLEIKGQPVNLKHVATWWVWHPLYLAICILATIGSLIFGFVPGWGGWVSAVCTLISTFTGFKAGVQYQREIIR